MNTMTKEAPVSTNDNAEDVKPVTEFLELSELELSWAGGGTAVVNLN